MQPAVTAGMGINGDDISREAKNIPPDQIFRIRRGGRLTAHGPGQLVIYPILPLRHWKLNLHQTLDLYQEWIILWLSRFKLQGLRRPGWTGVWLEKNGHFSKISAMGIGLRHGVSLHGISINIKNTKKLFESIIPCGNFEDGVIDLYEAASQIQNLPDMEEASVGLREDFRKIFHDVKNSEEGPPPG